MSLYRGARDHLALLVLPGDLLHVVVDVVVHGVGDAQHVVLGGDARAAALAVLHAAPERAPAAHAVRHEDVRLVDQLQVPALGLDEVQVPLYITTHRTYNCRKRCKLDNYIFIDIIIILKIIQIIYSM